MPEALSTHPQNYPHNPPVNQMRARRRRPVLSAERLCEVGRTLSYQWTKHCVEKYGADEVDEMVLGGLERAEHHATGTARARIISSSTITRWTACAARCRPRASAGRKSAGGPGGNFLREFLEHCAHGTNYVTGKIGSPLDFISFHAKGSPAFTNGHVRMGMASAVAEHERRLRRHRLISRIQKHAARHRRIRSRRLRRLHRPAGRPIATARCIPATPPRVFRARWISRTSTA